MDVKSRNNEKFEIFSNFLAHPVKSPRPILTVLHENQVCALHTEPHLATLRKIEMIAVRSTNETPHFWDLTPPAPPGADGSQRGKGHVGRHCPYTNEIHALLRYRSKSAKMQKFPFDSYSNKNFISPFFRPPGTANPKRGEDTSGTRVQPHAKFGLNRPAGCREIVDKKANKKYSKTNTSPFILTSEWRVIK